jgi:putative transposase
MTEMMSDVDDTKQPSTATDGDGVDARLVDQLVDRARAGGVRLTGEGGLLAQLTKRVPGVGAGWRDHRSPRLGLA